MIFATHKSGKVVSLNSTKIFTGMPLLIVKNRTLHLPFPIILLKPTLSCIRPVSVAGSGRDAGLGSCCPSAALAAGYCHLRALSWLCARCRGHWVVGCICPGIFGGSRCAGWRWKLRNVGRIAPGDTRHLWRVGDSSGNRFSGVAFRLVTAL